jgi:excisionase family DNA binding protein
MKMKAEQAPKRVELLTSAQMADRLGISMRQLYSAHSRGQLPAGRRIPGVGLRWRASDVDAWIERSLPPAEVA